MKKRPTPTNEKPSAPKRHSTASKFTGTDNPRYLRALHALLTRPHTREQLDRVAGCSNGPALVVELRRRGLDIPCDRVPVIDRDGREVKRGVYHLSPAARRRIHRWLAERSEAKGYINPEVAALLAVVAGPAALAVTSLLRLIGLV